MDSNTKTELLDQAAAAGADVKRAWTKQRIAEAIADLEAGHLRPDPDWHPVARRWFESLAESGQSRFYEPSDWATAYVIAESMSRDLKPQVVAVTDEGEPVRATVPLKGASVSAYLRAMTSLLITEGDRRRAQVELEREPSQPAASTVSPVALLDEYRQSS